MTASATSVFEAAAQAVEDQSELDRLAARGTLRLILKEAGFDAKSILQDEMVKVVEALLPSALRERGVVEADRVTAQVIDTVRAATPEDSGSERPERIFARLGS